MRLYTQQVVEHIQAAGHTMSLRDRMILRRRMAGEGRPSQDADTLARELDRRRGSMRSTLPLAAQPSPIPRARKTEGDTRTGPGEK